MRPGFVGAAVTAGRWPALPYAEGLPPVVGRGRPRADFPPVVKGWIGFMP
jgi:hypothetical protein